MNIPVEIREAIREAEMKQCAIATTFNTIKVMIESEKIELEREENRKEELS